MKYKKGDRLLLTDISKGDAARYATFIRPFDKGDRISYRNEVLSFWVLLLTGGIPVAIREDEIIKKLTEEEFNLVKIILD